jgi:2-C-methyl-D-erythritol 4-phosphate cytidylyltransferase/2-C-methyl-D-erythritol 2,4-cyclodiphosphate synthase
MYKEKKVSVVIAAAGAGSRMGGGIRKQYIRIQGKPMVVHAASAFWECVFVDHVCVVVNQDYDSEILNYLPEETVLVSGGSHRQDSVYNGLRSLPVDTDWVLVHDGARPFVSQEVILRVLDALEENPAVVPVVTPKDTIRTEKETLNRSDLKAVQTPQGFHIETLLEAYETAFERDYYGTDDSGLVERIGVPIALVEGDYGNRKITTSDDLPDSDYRIGTGFDFHPLVKERPLILGGVTIDHPKGLEGHSDADVLVHALMDALLGAMGLGDIGKHFPDTDAKFKDISSMILLKKVMGWMQDEAMIPVNVDLTLLCERPKLAPYVPDMKRSLTSALKIRRSQINIKATTMEGLGLVGREEGIGCQASVLLQKKNNND